LNSSDNENNLAANAYRPTELNGEAYVDLQHSDLQHSDPQHGRSTDLCDGELAGPGIPEPVAWRIWPIPIIVALAFFLHLFVSVITFFVAMFLVGGTVDAESFEDPSVLQSVSESRLGLSLTLVIPQTIMVLPVLVAAFLSPVPFRQRLALVRGNWPITLWISSAIATPIVGLVSSVIVGSLMGESESLNEMSDMFRTLGQSGFFIPLAMMVGLTPGICEELLFRGYVQTRLTQRIGAVFGVLLTSLVFAGFHMDLVHSTAVIAIGVYLGWLSWASGSIFPAMIGHFVNNFLSVAAVVLLPESMSGTGPVDPEEIPETVALVMAAIVLSSVVAFVFTLQQARKHRLRMASSVEVA
jgi:membrane protease YdiL (CAAX protease family)